MPVRTFALILGAVVCAAGATVALSFALSGGSMAWVSSAGLVALVVWLATRVLSARL